MATSNVTGLQDIVRQLNRRVRAVENSTKLALEDVALDIIGKSRPLAPLDTGDLRASGYTKIEGLKAEIGFTQHYAIKQHETLWYRHPRGGQAKFLESVFATGAERYKQHIKDAVIQAIRG